VRLEFREYPECVRFLANSLQLIAPHAILREEWQSQASQLPATLPCWVPEFSLRCYRLPNQMDLCHRARCSCAQTQHFRSFVDRQEPLTCCIVVPLLFCTHCRFSSGAKISGPCRLKTPPLRVIEGVHMRALNIFVFAQAAIRFVFNRLIEGVHPAV
jgi:hypothetical protein